ncbi:MAG: PucR family transcriptional regulator, partial [Lachnospiraceae bacterium]|nr:PucR family transcriptional regulator [Lachnospiraceae bacterium]
MISSQIIKTSIEELAAISKIDLAVWDLEGKEVAATFETEEMSPALITGFVNSPADSQVIGMH